MTLSQALGAPRGIRFTFDSIVCFMQLIVHASEQPSVLMGDKLIVTVFDTISYWERTRAKNYGLFCNFLVLMRDRLIVTWQVICTATTSAPMCDSISVHCCHGGCQSDPRANEPH